MERGFIWRWSLDQGTGVIKTDSGVLVWFHFSAFDNAAFGDVAEGLPVDVDIDHTPQGDFSCRASHIRLSVPSSWQS